MTRVSPRIAKEFRPLLLPWIVAALAAAGHLVALADPMFAKGEFGAFLVGLAGVGFVTGVLVLSALPVGFELHDRTLLLLLSQPAERARLWNEKLNAAALSVFALTIVHSVASVVTGHLSRPEAFLYAAFVVTAICSVGYHTLAARSVLVGIAGAIATPLAIVLGGHLFMYYALGLRIQLSEEETIALIIIGCTAYSAFSLWFGRRQFTTFELKDAGMPRGAQIPERLVPRRLTELFRAQPRGAVTNLIRKEICLQKPIFLVSAIFTAGWLLTLGMMVLRPAWHDNCVAVFHGLTGTQVVLMVILAGCVSLGDDKALGTAAWHLTLPVSARRQWFIKLLVAAATAVSMAVVLPTVLATLILFKAPVGLLALRPDQALGFVVPCTVVFVVSFWSASLVTSTVRAALTCMATLTGIAACVVLGARVPEAFFISSAVHDRGLQTSLIARILTYFGLPPDALGQTSIVPLAILFITLVLIVVILIQSLIQFRRATLKRSVMLEYSLILAAVTLLGSWWCSDLAASIQRLQGFQSEIGAAVSCLPQYPTRTAAGEPWEVTSQELEATGKLSSYEKAWLRNSSLIVHPSWQGKRIVEIRFPDERRVMIDLTYSPSP